MRAIKKRPSNPRLGPRTRLEAIGHPLEEATIKEIRRAGFEPVNTSEVVSSEFTPNNLIGGGAAIDCSNVIIKAKKGSRGKPVVVWWHAYAPHVGAFTRDVRLREYPFNPYHLITLHYPSVFWNAHRWRANEGRRSRLQERFEADLRDGRVRPHIVRRMHPRAILTAMAGYAREASGGGKVSATAIGGIGVMGGVPQLQEADMAHTKIARLLEELKEGGMVDNVHLRRFRSFGGKGSEYPIVEKNKGTIHR
jgi:hypothetical protein